MGGGGERPVCCRGKKSLLYHSLTNTDYPRGKLLGVGQEGKERPLFSSLTILGIAGRGGTVCRRGKKTINTCTLVYQH